VAFSYFLTYKLTKFVSASWKQNLFHEFMTIFNFYHLRNIAAVNVILQSRNVSDTVTQIWKDAQL